MNTNKLKFEDGYIKFGDTRLSKSLSFLRTWRGAVDLCRSTGITTAYKAIDFAKDVGMSPTQFMRVYNGVQRSRFAHCDNVAGVNFTTKCVFYGNPLKIDEVFVERMKFYESEIDNWVKDGYTNIIPILVRNNITPEFLRSKVSKKTWKKLLINSVTRNNLISKVIEFRGTPKDVCNSLCNVSSSVLLDVATFKLSGVPRIDFGITLYGVKTSDTYSKNKAHYDKVLVIDKISKSFRKLTDSTFKKEIFDICSDTLQMQIKLCKSKNIKSMSLQQLKNWHDKLADELVSLKYSKNKFKWISTVKEEYVMNECVASLLQSPADYEREGATMRHCIAGYSGHANAGEYIAYHISGCGEETTIAFQKSNGSWIFNQHYGKCNARVKSKTHSQFKDVILKDLNNVKL